MHKLVTVTLVAALHASVAHSANDFVPPKGCQTFLTVQSRECAVWQMYRCDSDPDGVFWEALFSADGMESVAQYSRDYLWLDVHYFWDGSREVFLAPAEDPNDMDALARDGIDTFRYTVHRTAPGEDRLVTIVGADVLTGETTEIDGVALARVQTELQILNDAGEVEYRSRGLQYLDMERGLFFAGQDVVIDADGVQTEYEGSPVDFIEPGQTGFQSTLPLYECNEQKAGFVVPDDGLLP